MCVSTVMRISTENVAVGRERERIHGTDEEEHISDCLQTQT